MSIDYFGLSRDTIMSSANNVSFISSFPIVIPFSLLWFLILISPLSVFGKTKIFKNLSLFHSMHSPDNLHNENRSCSRCHPQWPWNIWLWFCGITVKRLALPRAGAIIVHHHCGNGLAMLQGHTDLEGAALMTSLPGIASPIPRGAQKISGKSRRVHDVRFYTPSRSYGRAVRVFGVLSYLDCLLFLIT